jgi:hypothetical protein
MEKANEVAGRAKRAAASQTTRWKTETGRARPPDTKTEIRNTQQDDVQKKVENKRKCIALYPQEFYIKRVQRKKSFHIHNFLRCWSLLGFFFQSFFFSL